MLVKQLKSLMLLGDGDRIVDVWTSRVLRLGAGDGLLADGEWTSSVLRRGEGALAVGEAAPTSSLELKLPDRERWWRRT